MPSGYLQVLRAPGAVRPVIGTAVGTLPVGMLGLAVLLLVRESRGDFGSAGVVIGLLGVGTGIGMPAQGRLLDRLGQWTVLVPAAMLHLGALSALVFATEAEAPIGVLATLAFAAGLGEPQLSGCLRALWGDLVPDGLRASAYALNSIVFEVPVVLGPMVVAALVAIGDASLAVLASGFLAASGPLVLATSAASRGWRSELRAPVGWAGALSVGGVRMLVVVGAGQGIVVTMLQLASAGLAAEEGQLASTGVLFTAISLGSLVGAFAWGARAWPGTVAVRLVFLLVGLAIGATVCLLAPGIPALAVALFLTGTMFAPIIIASSTLLDDLSPAGTLTEAYALIVAGGIAGVSVASAVGGRIVDAFGADATFILGAIVAVVTAAIVRTGLETLHAP